MTQDSNQRVLGKWLTNQYDVENRPDSTGLLTDPNTRSYHQNLAASSSDYPATTGGNYEWLTRVYYDNYGWVTPATSLLSFVVENVGATHFITTYNTSPIYALQFNTFYNTRGMVTGHMTKVIGTTNTYLYSNIFYDDHSRELQTQSTNYTGGVDTLTTQVDFSGMPIRVQLDHKNHDNGGDYLVVTKLAYDPAFRLKSIYKNINNAANDQLIDSMQYNELGQLRAKYLGNNVDSLVYAYNIRGWLTGINPNYVAGSGTNYFGMELGYDKTTSVAPGNTYTTPEYNGNIEGTVWKTAGSGTNRKYDFSYDEVNRLTGANFNQYNGSGFDKSAKIDFSVSNLNYDANGNILAMRQMGFKVGGSTPIDVLTYGYGSTPTNQLQGVADSANSDSTLLGDFHYNPATKQTTDYAYDGNGNLHLDNNKAIDSIGYNYLNLPQYVHMKGKGTIVYTYDAAGTRWEKTVIDSLAKDSTITLYLGGFVYQHKDSFVNSGGGLDTLQFMSHEEGRARWAAQKSTTTGAIGYSFQYDFFEKDHLGNTRMLLTQERDTTNYLASMEAAYRSTESQLFGNIASTCVAWTSMPNYQNIPNSARYAFSTTNDSVSKVDYTGSGGQTTGPSLLLKVMSGDTVMPGVQSYYNSNTITTTNSSFTSVLNSLASGLLGTPTGAAEGGLSGYTSNSGPVYGAISSFLSTKDQAPPTGYPKAYLNWILLDDQFNYVSSSSGSVAVASLNYPAGQLNSVAAGGPVVMTRNGYLYVWVSNETQGWDVFFDNLSVQYKQGPVLEENHYYPGGMQMPGRSFNAPSLINGYNGKRYDNEVYGVGNFMDYGERMYDPRIVRFPSVDPLTRKYPELTPYQYASNRPIDGVDKDGKEWMQAQARLIAQNALIKIDQARVKANSRIQTLSATPSRDQVQQYQQEQYNIQRFQDLGYNDDGSQPFLMRAAQNKTFKAFSENIALPFLETAAGEGAGKILFSGAAKVETFFRAMSKEEFATFSSTGQLPAGGEKFISTQLEYSKGYIGKPGYDVLVQFNTKEGTLQQLAKIGVRDNSILVKQKGFGNLPDVFKGWSPTNALFKGEGSTLNIGLGNGKALAEFNKSITSFNVVTP